MKDFYFDDRAWRIRYFVVTTGGWLSGREVLIAPAVVRAPDWREGRLPVDLTVEQVRRSPGVDLAQPVSREDELKLTRYYNWPEYWIMAGSADGGMGMTLPPPVLPPDAAAQAAAARRGGAGQVTGEHHLRSVRAVRGHAIEAVDGPIGHVEDFVFDESHWEIRYLVVDTRNWWPGKKVLVAPQWIAQLGWEEPKVFVDLSRTAIQGSPLYDPATPITPEYAGQLHDYYGRARHEAW